MRLQELKRELRNCPQDKVSWEKGCGLVERAGEFSVSLLLLPLPCCVTLSMLLELSELVFLSVKWSYLPHRLE